MEYSPQGPRPLDAAGRPLDVIELTGLSAEGRHGVLAAERRDGQPFRADVRLFLDTRAAARDDHLAATLDYGAMAEALSAELAGEPVALIETLAERLARRAAVGPVVAVEVTIHKPLAPIPVPFDDVTVTIRRTRAELTDDPALATVPSRAVVAVLALGANVGEPVATLRAAVRELGVQRGIELTGVSPLARTRPVGPQSQPDFVNAVVQVATTLAPRQLLETCLELERAHGRVREQRWGPRTLDVDIVAYADLEAQGPGLSLPHPRAHERAFVLAPWVLMDPEARLPGAHGGRVAELAAAAPDAAGLAWLAPSWPWDEVGEV